MKKLYERIAAEFTPVPLPTTPSGYYLRDDGTWQPASGGSLPSGIIVMWSGLRSNIPTGWYLCNGTSGTPNLSDKFILSVTGSEEAGGTGGSSSLSHSGTAVGDHAALTHTGTAVTSHPATATAAANIGTTNSGPTASTLTLKAHTHTTPVLAHTVTQPSQHAIQTHSVTQPSNHADSRPPYYKLCFIMKG